MGLLVLFSWYLKVSRIQSTTSVLCVGLLCAFLDLELGGRRAAIGLVCFWEYGFLVLEGAVLTADGHLASGGGGNTNICKTRPLPGPKSPVLLSSGKFNP